MSGRTRRAGPARRADAGPLDGAVVGVIGLGLIGGSVVRCLHRQRPRLAVIGHDRQQALAARMRPFGHWCATLGELVANSDVIVLAAPVPAIVALLPRIGRLAAGRHRARRLVVCDMGSVKAPVRDAAGPWAAAFDYVGLHPMAGGEHGGWDAADPDLFRGRTVVYCGGGARLRRLARDLIARLGGCAQGVDAAAHDRVVAETIGLPHLLAFAAARLARPLAAGERGLRGGSWASLTRVSVSDPAMVAGFLQPNAAHQRRVLKAFRAELDRLGRLLDRPTVAPLERAMRHGSRVLPGSVRRRS